MANYRKKQGHGFLIFMLVYSILLIAVIGSGLTFLWKYLISYEASFSTDAIHCYETERLHSDFRNAVSQYADSLATPFQSGEQILPVVAEGFDESQLNLKKESTPDVSAAPVYLIRLGKEPVGKVYMRYSELPFGLKTAEYDRTEWNLSAESGKDYSVIAPENAPVSVNGVVLDGTNSVKEQAEHVVGTLTQGFDPVYDSKYTFVYYGVPDPKVPEDGENAFTITREVDGNFSVFAVCTEAQVAELTPFVEQFVNDYMLFTSNAASYAVARQHMIPDTPLYQRVSGSVDGMRWVAGVTSRLSDLKVSNFVPYGDGVICQANYKLTDTADNVRESMMKILMVKYQGNWKVYNIQMF